jgi:hypothetical protein
MEMDTDVNCLGSPTSAKAGLEELALRGKKDPRIDPTVESTVKINETPTSDPPNIT